MNVYLRSSYRYGLGAIPADLAAQLNAKTGGQPASFNWWAQFFTEITGDIAPAVSDPFDRMVSADEWLAKAFPNGGAAVMVPDIPVPNLPAIPAHTPLLDARFVTDSARPSVMSNNTPDYLGKQLKDWPAEIRTEAVSAGIPDDSILVAGFGIVCFYSPSNDKLYVAEGHPAKLVVMTEEQQKQVDAKFLESARKKALDMGLVISAGTSIWVYAGGAAVLLIAAYAIWGRR